MALATVSAVGAGIAALALFYRKKLERSFGVHDESNEEDVNGKIVIITGANTGLGKVASYEFARRGATVVMACRDENRAAEAIRWIQKRTSNGSLIPMTLDLSSLESIRTFASNVSKKFTKIDILINNAGVFVPLEKRLKTQDGFEINFGVNHLGHFLLTNLLLDSLRLAAPSRIVFVASTLSQNGKIDFDDLMLEHADPKGKVSAYGNSKLANILCARELANKLSGTGVHVYALCPGWVKTDLARYMDLSWIKYIMIIPAAFMFMRSPHQGCQTILHCSLSKETANETGKLYRNCDHWVTTSKLSDDLAKRLWQISEKLVSL